jgi:glucose/arabinose dehydrogenase
MKNAAVAFAIGLLSVGALLSGTCVSAGSSSVDVAASIRLVVDGLDYPASFVAEDERRTLVLEKDQGTIRVVEDGRILDESFLDIHSRLIGEPNIEEGLLSAALPPKFPDDPSIYVSYIGADGNLRLSRFRVVDDGYHALPESEEILFSVHPDNRMHYCGHIVFGPKDGLLYMCIGDTQNNRLGERYRPLGTAAQDLTRPHGKIIRLELGPGAPGRSLPGRPALAGTEAVRARFWAYGLRNPWRFAFDRETGDLLIPDVGRYHWEEVNYRPAAQDALLNYGWPLAEGNACTLNCSGQDLVWPIYQHPSRDLFQDSDRELTCAIIGGVVYRGRDYPTWQGVYVFGDYCSGELWALRDFASKPELRRLADTDLTLTAIGTDYRGEILLTDGGGGALYALAFPSASEVGWVGVEEHMHELLLQADRTGYGRANEQLDAILRSRRYQLAQQLATVYHWLRSAF